MAMMASNGVCSVDDVGLDEGSVLRSDTEPRRSAAAPMTVVDEDWTCEAEYSLPWH